MAKLLGSVDVEAAADVCRNVADTQNTATAGKLFGVANNATVKFAIDYTGAPILTTAAVTPLGTNQATAAALTAPVSVVTGADGTLSVRLPTAVAGKVMYVYGATATNGLPIYPATDGTINGGSADTAVTIEGKTLAKFVGTSATNWAAFYTAN
jgi:hypothetical protein